MFAQISDFFKMPHRAFRTAGIQDGMILQFCHCYLKIYPERDGSYKILQYKYGHQNPIACNVVPMNGIQKFAQKFARYYRDFTGTPNIEEQLSRIPPPQHCHRE